MQPLPPDIIKALLGENKRDRDREREAIARAAGIFNLAPRDDDDDGGATTLDGDVSTSGGTTTTHGHGPSLAANPRFAVQVACEHGGVGLLLALFGACDARAHAPLRQVSARREQTLAPRAHLGDGFWRWR